MKFKGLSVSVIVHKDMSDSSANGISSKNDSLILIGENGEDLDSPFKGDENNTVMLVKRYLSNGIYLHCEPVKKPEGMNGPMFGGNFIYTSDSRFPSKYPIPIHDRFETQEQYNTLST